MNNVPKPQKYLVRLSWFFAGVMGLGSFIGVIDDTLNFVTLPISIIGTVLIIIFYFGAQQYLKRYPWHTEYGRVTQLNLGMALPLIGMIGLLWLPQLIQFMPGPRAFPSAHPGEALIVITTFHHTEGVADVAAHDEIRRAIQQKIDELNFRNVRVEVEPTVIESTNREQAAILGNRYNATLVIWGSDTGVRLEINFLNLEEKNFVAADVTITETTKTQLAKPDAYGQFVIDELPRQLTYLSLFSIAQIEFGQGDYDIAIGLMETAISSLNPLTDVNETSLELDEAYFNLGLLYQLTNEPDEALVSYSQSLAMNAQHSDAYNNRGVVNTHLRNYEQAIADYNLALNLYSTPEGKAIVYANRGLVYDYLGYYEEALKDYGQSLELNPNSALTYHNRGRVYINLGRYEQAIADYNRALSINPAFVEAYTNRGLAYAYSENHRQAIENYSQALGLNPESETTYNNRGIAYSELGNHEQAIADYNQALLIDPDFSAAYINRAATYTTLGQYRQAVADYDSALTLSPELAEAYAGRGKTYVRLADYEQAIADYNQALSIDPELTSVHTRLGEAYIYLGDFSQALANLDKSISLDPGNAEAYMYRGVVHAALQDYEKAIVAYDQALRLDADLGAVYLNRSMSLAHLGQHDRAAADLQAYLELNPQLPEREVSIIVDSINQLSEELDN